MPRLSCFVSDRHKQGCNQHHMQYEVGRRRQDAKKHTVYDPVYVSTVLGKTNLWCLKSVW